MMAITGKEVNCLYDKGNCVHIPTVAKDDKLRQKQLALIGSAIDQTLQFFATCIHPV